MFNAFHERFAESKYSNSVDALGLRKSMLKSIYDYQWQENRYFVKYELKRVLMRKGKKRDSYSLTDCDRYNFEGKMYYVYL